jgi:uncharacterized protein (DUF58 family)
MLLGIMSTSGIFGKRNLSALEVDILFPEEIYANRTCNLTIRLKNNRSALPVFLMKVVVGNQHVSFPFVDAKGEKGVSLPFSFPERGRGIIEGVYLESPFPFSFFIRRAPVARSFPLIVFPEPLSCHMASISGEDRTARGESLQGMLGDSTELAAIRAYVPGDPLKYVNWKATAKTGIVKTSLFSATSRRPVFIDFDKVDIRGTEVKISSVTFAVLDLMAKGIPVGVRFSLRSYPPALSRSHKYSVMKELALYDQPR